MQWLYKNKEISYSVCSEVADFDMSLDLQCTHVAVLFWLLSHTRTDNFIAVDSMLTLLSLELVCCDSIITVFCHWLLKLCSFYNTHTDTHTHAHNTKSNVYISFIHMHISPKQIYFSLCRSTKTDQNKNCFHISACLSQTQSQSNPVSTDSLTSSFEDLQLLFHPSIKVNLNKKSKCWNYFLRRLNPSECLNGYEQKIFEYIFLCKVWYLQCSEKSQ